MPIITETENGEKAIKIPELSEITLCWDETSPYREDREDKNLCYTVKQLFDKEEYPIGAIVCLLKPEYGYETRFEEFFRKTCFDSYVFAHRVKDEELSQYLTPEEIELAKKRMGAIETLLSTDTEVRLRKDAEEAEYKAQLQREEEDEDAESRYEDDL